jgi:hypothetical protein
MRLGVTYPKLLLLLFFPLTPDGPETARSHEPILSLPLNQR